MRLERGFNTMMKKEVFPDKEIQGLLPRKDPEGPYWLLLAKVTLSKFQKTKLEEVMKE
jgi:hypothetical protein